MGPEFMGQSTGSEGDGELGQTWQNLALAGSIAHDGAKQNGPETEVSSSVWSRPHGKFGPDCHMLVTGWTVLLGSCSSGAVAVATWVDVGCDEGEQA